MSLGAIVTLGIALLGYGAVTAINFLGELDPIYPLALVVIGVWAFCTAMFYSFK